METIAFLLTCALLFVVIEKLIVILPMTDEARKWCTLVLLTIALVVLINMFTGTVPLKLK